jgi:hypothetical protein
VGRRSRKRRPGEAAATARPPQPKPPSTPSRSERKDAEARAALMPLEEGERPVAVTVAAFVTLAVLLANVIIYAAGVKVQGDQPPLPGFALFTLLAAAMAWGLWRARYWAVLGLQALLAILILMFSIFLVRFSSVLDVVICLGVIVPSITLFYFLIKAMARIQMPERPV